MADFIFDDMSDGEFQEQLNDQLTCSVCRDHYTNPKTLPCQHSFCLECIEALPIKIKVRELLVWIKHCS